MTIACRYVNGAAARTVIAAAPYRRSAEPALNARLQRSGSGVRRGDGWRVQRVEGAGRLIRRAVGPASVTRPVRRRWRRRHQMRIAWATPARER